jgi:hypothetical protein
MVSFYSYVESNYMTASIHEDVKFGPLKQFSTATVYYSHGRRPGLNKVKQKNKNLDKFWFFFFLFAFKRLHLLFQKVTLAVSKVRYLPRLPPLRYGHDSSCVKPARWVIMYIHVCQWYRICFIHTFFTGWTASVV